MPATTDRVEPLLSVNKPGINPLNCLTELSNADTSSFYYWAGPGCTTDSTAA